MAKLPPGHFAHLSVIALLGSGHPHYTYDICAF